MTNLNNLDKVVQGKGTKMRKMVAAILLGALAAFAGERKITVRIPTENLDEFRRVHALCGRPMLVTEWSFPALDAGRPCLHGAGQRFHTQEERATAVELFSRTILSEPYMVGYNWFRPPVMYSTRFCSV